MNDNGYSLATRRIQKCILNILGSLLFHIDSLESNKNNRIISRLWHYNKFERFDNIFCLIALNGREQLVQNRIIVPETIEPRNTRLASKPCQLPFRVIAHVLLDFSTPSQITLTA